MSISYQSESLRTYYSLLSLIEYQYLEGSLHHDPPVLSGPTGHGWRVLTKRGALEKGMANHYSILALRTPNSMKKQKDKTLEDELPRLVGAQYATGDQ